MSQARFDTLSNLEETESIDVTNLITSISNITGAGVSLEQTRQTMDSDTNLNDFTAGFFLDSWFGSKPQNAPNNFSDYGTFLQIGRTQLVVDNSQSAFSGISVRSFDENNQFTDWRNI